MAISYLQSEADALVPVPASPVVNDESDSWWGGAQRCFAAVAIVATLAICAASTAQCQNLQQQNEEVTQVPSSGGGSWSQWPLRYQSGAILVRYLERGSEDFVGPAFQPDEDYWQNPVPPLASSIYQKLPYVPDPEEVPAGQLYGQADEDFWQNPVAPVPQSLYQRLPLGDPEEIPAGNLYGQPDEDFWQNPVAAVAASLYQRLPLGDPEELPAGRLSGQPDEDFWSNPAAPVAASLYQRLPYLPDPEEISAGNLHGQPDEDFWQSPTSPVAATLYQRLPLGDPEELPAGNLRGTAEEDFWQNPVAPVPLSLFQRLPLGDPEELAAGDFFGQPDEDYWVNPVAPVAGALYQRLPLGDPEEIPAGNLRGLPEEELWQSPIFPLAATNRWPQQFAFDTQEPALRAQLEEDYWQNAVRPVPVSLYQWLPLGDPEEIPGNLLAQPEPSTGVISRGSRRHIGAAPYELRPLSNPPIAVRATPEGLQVRAVVGTVEFASGAGVAKPASLSITATLHKPLVIGILDISDDDLIFLLSAL
jgi:hypothetical protein